jgi:hypothetical protein
VSNSLLFSIGIVVFAVTVCATLLFVFQTLGGRYNAQMGLEIEARLVVQDIRLAAAAELSARDSGEPAA